MTGGVSGMQLAPKMQLPPPSTRLKLAAAVARTSLRRKRVGRRDSGRTSLRRQRAGGVSGFSLSVRIRVPSI